MKGEDFIGYSPENPHWSISGNRIYFHWNPEMNPGYSLYAYEISTGKTQLVTVDYLLEDPEFSPVQSKNEMYFTVENSLYAYNLSSKKSILINSSKRTISSLSFNYKRNALLIFYNDEVVQYNLSDNSTLTIISFEKGDSPTPVDSTLLMKEEHRLFEFNRLQEEKSKWNNENAWQLNPVRQIYIGKSSISNIQISTSGRYFTFRLNDYPHTESTEVMHFITHDGEAKPDKARPKAGTPEPTHRIGIYDSERDTVYFANLSTLPDIRKKPAYLNSMEPYETDRKTIPHQLHFSPDSDNNVVDVRSYDNKDRWIISLNLENGSIICKDHQHDEAWIGGPGISSWNMVEGTLGWLSNGESFYFQSEATSFSHLYLMDFKSGNKKQLTNGNWEVRKVALSKDGSKFYLTTNRSHPGNRDFEVYDINKATLSSIYTKNGAHECTLSPDEKHIATRYSYRNKPWELYYAETTSKNEFVQITHSTTSDFEKITWYDPEVISLKNEENNSVYARVYSPENPNRSAVIFVHGAGYLQNAHNYWSLYFHEYLFHNLLRSKGYTVLDIDYRASDGYGRDHRAAIYRHMGGADLKDQLIGRQYLIDSMQIDPKRIGIYGGSYGGFITLMALLTEPGKFKCGAALRSVTDWMHYNHEYSTNILNYPATDPEAYRVSSPINYAENLQDQLLMLHGMVDDNVQFQDVVRLSQRFVELGKTNWNLAVYPVEAHGFKINSSWQDEYRRILELFETQLIPDGN